MLIASHPHGSPPTLHALAIGDRSSRELAGALAALERAMPTRYLPTLPEAIADYSAEVAPPDLLVLLQSRGGQFSDSELLRIRSCMPLAPVLAVLGSWCEGEIRSARLPAAVRRVAWHDWQYHLERELRAWKSGNLGTWSLPATASEEELLLEPVDGPQKGWHLPGPIAIRTPNPDLAACLGEALAGCGCSGIAVTGSGPAGNEQFSALIDDLTLPADARRLALEYRAWQPRPVVALADFPRPQDESAIRQLGAAILLAKPVDLAELAERLERLLATQAASGE